MELIQEFQLLDIYPVKRYRWENGFQALLAENPISPVLAYLTHYTVGSAQETERQRGLAHFFEHMMFRETETRADGDFDRIVAESGGVGLNAYTSFDTTAYHVNVPFAQLEKIVQLESDRMANLRLSTEMIERERGAVLGEMRMYKDMPSEEIWNTLMSTAYDNHTYRHPIIGYMEQVEGFQVPDFQSFYGAHYAPNRAIVVVAGGFDQDETLSLLDKAYSSLSPGEERPENPPAEKPWTDSRRVEIFHEKVSSESITIAMQTPGIHHADIPGLQLLSMMLSGGRSSPLHRRLVLSGLATHASASVLDVDWMLSSPGLFLIDAAMQHGVASERAEEVVDEVLAEFRRGIPAEEFERALNQLRLSRYSSLRNNMSLARYLGGYTTACGDPLFGEKMARAVEQVTAEQLMELMDKYLVAAPKVVVIQRPATEGQA